MSSVTYNYAVGQEVFHVDANKGVRDAVVKSLTLSITQSGTVIIYDVAYKKPTEGVGVVAEANLYGDVDSALAAYKLTVVV